MTERRPGTPRRTARRGLPVTGAVPPRRPVAPVTRRKGPFILLALIVVMLTAGLAARRIVATGYFEVNTITVQGAGVALEPDVLAAVDLSDKQIWQVDEGAVAAVVEGVPGVKTARVRRAWPNKVTVVVDERVPAAVWRAGDRDLVVDEDGYVLDAPVMGGLPAISHTDAGLNAVDRVDGDAVRLAIRLGPQVAQETGQRVARYEFSSAAGFDVVTERGLRVRLGDGANLDSKLALWRGIAEQARKDKITPSEIDLRFGEWAAVR